MQRSLANGSQLALSIAYPVCRIVPGDCLDVLADMPPNTVDLIVTSPPYADARQRTYGGCDLRSAAKPMTECYGGGRPRYSL